MKKREAVVSDMQQSRPICVLSLRPILLHIFFPPASSMLEIPLAGGDVSLATLNINID